MLGSTAERYPAPIYPAHPGHRGGSLPVWSTYGELTPAAFPKPPVNDKPTPGVVRIAFDCEAMWFRSSPVKSACDAITSGAPARIPAANGGRSRVVSAARGVRN